MTNYQDGQEKMSDAAGWSGRMSPERSHQTSGVTSKRSSRKSSASQSQKPPMFLCLTREGGQSQDASWEWTAAGQSHTEFSMLNTGAFPKDAVESTLSQILEAQAHPKYYLSEMACLGILRRAEKRGKELPDILKQTLIRQSLGVTLIRSESGQIAILQRR